MFYIEISAFTLKYTVSSSINRVNAINLTIAFKQEES